MNKKYIALLFSLMAAIAPSATLAKSKKNKNKTAQKNNRKKWIIGTVVVIGSVAALGFGFWKYNDNKKKNGDSDGEQKEGNMEEIPMPEVLQNNNYDKSIITDRNSGGIDNIMDEQDRDDEEIIIDQNENNNSQNAGTENEEDDLSGGGSGVPIIMNQRGRGIDNERDKNDDGGGIDNMMDEQDKDDENEEEQQEVIIDQDGGDIDDNNNQPQEPNAAAVGGGGIGAINNQQA